MPLKRIDWLIRRQEIRASTVMLFSQFPRTIGAFRIASGYRKTRKSRNPELARNKLSYLREKSRASAVCIVSQSEAARRSHRIKSERRNGQGTENCMSSVRSPIRPFIRSYWFFFCSLWLRIVKWRTHVGFWMSPLDKHVRDASYSCIRTRVRRRVTSVATFACVFRFGTRYNIAVGRRKNVAYVQSPAVSVDERSWKICLAPGNTFRLVINADIVGLKMSRRTFYADSTLW